MVSALLLFINIFGFGQEITKGYLHFKTEIEIIDSSKIQEIAPAKKILGNFDISMYFENDTVASIKFDTINNIFSRTINISSIPKYQFYKLLNDSFYLDLTDRKFARTDTRNRGFKIEINRDKTKIICGFECYEVRAIFAPSNPPINFSFYCTDKIKQIDVKEFNLLRFGPEIGFIFEANLENSPIVFNRVVDEFKNDFDDRSVFKMDTINIREGTEEDLTKMYKIFSSNFETDSE